MLSINAIERRGNRDSQRAHACRLVENREDVTSDQPQVPRDTGEALVCSQHLYPHYIQRQTDTSQGSRFLTLNELKETVKLLK